jgi:hypothetical protein
MGWPSVIGGGSVIGFETTIGGGMTGKEETTGRGGATGRKRLVDFGVLARVQAVAMLFWQHLLRILPIT